MSETETVNLLDSITTVARKMFKSDKTKKNPKLEELIAMFDKMAEKAEKMVYAKTAEAQLEAEKSIIRTSRGLERNNARNITRGKNTRKIKPQEVNYNGDNRDIDL